MMVTGHLPACNWPASKATSATPFSLLTTAAAAAPVAAVDATTPATKTAATALVAERPAPAAAIIRLTFQGKLYAKGCAWHVSGVT